MTRRDTGIALAAGRIAGVLSLLTTQRNRKIDPLTLSNRGPGVTLELPPDLFDELALAVNDLTGWLMATSEKERNSLRSNDSLDTP